VSISPRIIGRRATTASASLSPPHDTKILSSPIDTLGLAVIVGHHLWRAETKVRLVFVLEPDEALKLDNLEWTRSDVQLMALSPKLAAKVRPFQP
jgi:hypothetical protein